MKGIGLASPVRAVARLSVSTSLLALGLLAATSASAQDEPEAGGAAVEKPGSEIVVTGTRIKGVAPVGSAVVPIGREDMEKMGVSTTNDALRKLPQIVNFGASDDQSGGTVIQNSSLNTFFAKSINLRGLGTAATLSLVNGHRVAPQGPNGQLYDADNIPGIALERIEVVADGGSAIYGSDAIGGVVNFITRRPQDTVEARFRAGFADSVQEYIGSVAAGHTWGSGGIFLAYEYQRRSALEASDRPKLYNSDLTPYGGAAWPILSNPGNVQFVTNGPAYGIPAGQDGRSVTLGDLTTTPNRQNPWQGADAAPKTKRNSVVGTFEQAITDTVKLKADGFFSRREYKLDGIPQSSTLTVPSNNPYSPCHTGTPDDSATLNCPGNGNVLVAYNFLNDLGPATSTGYEQLWSISGGLDITLNDKWDANVLGYYSEDKGDSYQDNFINSNGLRRALGETVSGAAKPAGVDFFNPFCDGNAFQCNSEETISLFRAFTEIGSKYSTYGGTANIGGALFDIGGGDVRLALGGEYHHDALSGTGQISNTRTANVDTVTSAPVSNQRKVASAYAELFVPFVGNGNAMPGIARLDFDAAVRYDHYSDVGSTVNPKFGLNYSPVDGLTFRGSYGTSFRAPSLVDVNKYATAGFLVRTGASGTAVGLDPPNGSFMYVYPIGGNPNLRPEKATTWSAGFDIGPELIPNAHFSLTYYNVKYTDKIDTAAYNVPIGTALNSGLYDNFVVFNPLYFPTKTSQTIDQFVDYWNTITSDPGLPVLGFVADPKTIIAIVDSRRNNSGVAKTDGLDLNFNYVIDSDWATFHLGAQANYTLHYRTAPVPGIALSDEVNHFGYPARFTGRLEFGLEKGGLTASAYVNYVNSRKITRAFLPAAIPDQYLKIGSYTTVDMTVRYEFEDTSKLFSGLAFSVSALNVFDKDPPLVVNTGGTPIRFDPSYSSSLGRMVSFEISKKF